MVIIMRDNLERCRQEKGRSFMFRNYKHYVFSLVLTCLVFGCGDSEKQGEQSRERKEQFEQQIRAKWNQSYSELPVDKLAVISPHNKDIQDEFANAFSRSHALKNGRRVDVEYLDVGGGGTKIVSHLRTIYERAKTSNVDIVWGGGDDNFILMASEGILQPLTIPDDYIANVPSRFGGLPMYDATGQWAGTALSGFGLLYNRVLLQKLKVPEPKLWDDLGKAEYFGLISMADPVKSSSAAAANKMIVQSADSWPEGWAKLLSILGNVKRFYDSASGAADAVVSEAPIATCIDFYGVIRVSKYPQRLCYISPQGQTVFNADPIAILRNPPHPEIAQTFVDFVLSVDGQALWALPPGTEKGPDSNALYRIPIRKDVFEIYSDKLIKSIEPVFQTANEMQIKPALQKVDYDVLKYLVYAAAVSNDAVLKSAKANLIKKGSGAEAWREFSTLPPNIRTVEQFAEIARKLNDDKEAEQIHSDWVQFFADQFSRLSQ